MQVVLLVSRYNNPALLHPLLRDVSRNPSLFLEDSHRYSITML